MTENMRKWLASHFSENPGYEDNVPFKLIGDRVQLISVDSHFKDGAFERFQGIITYPHDKWDPNMLLVPLWLTPYIRAYEALTYYRDINAICYTIWFKEPLTEHKWKEISNMKPVEPHG